MIAKWFLVGATTRPRPVWAQMMVVFGWRLKRALICAEVSRFVWTLPRPCERNIDIVVDKTQPDQLRRQTRVYDRVPGSAGLRLRRVS